jgi:hypothetical protein
MRSSFKWHIGIEFDRARDCWVLFWWEPTRVGHTRGREIDSGFKTRKGAMLAKSHNYRSLGMFQRKGGYRNA